MIDRLVGGCAAAWETFVERYGGLLRSRVANVAVAFGLPHDWALIDDVTAEVFASLLSRDAAALRCFRGQSQLSTYLAVISTRVARRSIAKHRQNANRQTEMGPLELEQVTDESVDSSGPQAVAVSGEDRDRLLELVDRLPIKQRDLVRAYYQDEQSYSEISKRFEIPLGSIGTTLRRAEQRLREWIDDET
ncbi:MAG: RNA polymerase sigma factor [Planctomycetota bacterium]